MKRIAILLAWVCGSIIAAVLVTLAIFVGGFAIYTAGIRFDEPVARVPFSRLTVTRTWGTPKEIFATVAPGVAVCDVVACEIFDGFDAKMSQEVALEKIGAPSGQWVDPWCGADAPYYERPAGRVSLCRTPDSGGFHWETVGHPKERGCDHVFRDSEARAQVMQFASAGRSVQVNVLRDIGWGGITVFLSREDCGKLILTARDAMDREPPNNELQRTRPAQATEPRR